MNDEDEIPAFEDDGLSEWDDWDNGGKEAAYEENYRNQHDET